MDGIRAQGRHPRARRPARGAEWTACYWWGRLDKFLFLGRVTSMSSLNSSNVGSEFDKVKPMNTHVVSYTDELAREREKYKDLGQREAAKHLPPTDATSLDKNEAQLLADANKHLAVQRNFFDYELQQSITALSALEQRLIHWRTKAEMSLSEPDLSLAVGAELAEDRQALVLVTEKRMRSDVALRTFRVREGIPLDETARYPESSIWHFAIVAVLGLGETVANAFFYQNSQGLLGGIIMAIMVAAVNLSVAIGLGWLSRYRNLLAPDKKAMGWAAIVAFVLWTLYSNALFAAFRSEYRAVADPDNARALAAAFSDAARSAWGVFTFNLKLGDFESFILFGIGLVLSVLAFWKGLTSDDKYPGHSTLDKVSKADREAERSSWDTNNDKMKAFLRRKVAETQSLLSEPPMLINETVSKSGALSQAGALYAARQQSVQRDLELVLTAYRQANVSIRATDPPSYFSAMPSLPQADTGPVFAHTIESLGKLKADVGAARMAMEGLIQAKVHKLLTTTSTTLVETLKSFRVTITDEATEQINTDLQTLHLVNR